MMLNFKIAIDNNETDSFQCAISKLYERKLSFQF